jgi:nitroreductase
MTLLPHIEHRVTIRNFTLDPVNQESLDSILEAARLAPSAKNRQPWRFIVIQDSRVLKQIQDAAYNEPHVSSAPVLIAACTTNVDYRMPNGQTSYPIDIATAVAFMIIQAEEEKLGSSIVTTFDETLVKEILSVPHSMRVVMLLALGHPENRPLRPPRRSADQIISYNHW